MAVSGGDLRWRSLVVISSGDLWWQSLVAVCGGGLWWRSLEAVSGGGLWWQYMVAISGGNIWCRSLVLCWQSLVVALYKWTLHDCVLFIMESRRSSTEGRVHALILSSHIFVGLPCFLLPSFVPCNNSLGVLLCLEENPYHNS